MESPVPKDVERLGLASEYHQAILDETLGRVPEGEAQARFNKLYQEKYEERLRYEYRETDKPTEKPYSHLIDKFYTVEAYQQYTSGQYQTALETYRGIDPEKTYETSEGPVKGSVLHEKYKTYVDATHKQFLESLKLKPYHTIIRREEGFEIKKDLGEKARREWKTLSPIQKAAKMIWVGALRWPSTIIEGAISPITGKSVDKYGQELVEWETGTWEMAKQARKGQITTLLGIVERKPELIKTGISKQIPIVQEVVLSPAMTQVVYPFALGFGITAGLGFLSKVAPAIGTIAKSIVYGSGTALVSYDIGSKALEGKWRDVAYSLGYLAMAVPITMAAAKHGFPAGARAGEAYLLKSGKTPYMGGVKQLNVLRGYGQLAKAKALGKREVPVKEFHEVRWEPGLKRELKLQVVDKPSTAGGPKALLELTRKSVDPLTGRIVTSHASLGFFESTKAALSKPFYSSGMSQADKALALTTAARSLTKPHSLSAIIRTPMDKAVIDAARMTPGLILHGSAAMKLQAFLSVKNLLRKIGDIDFYTTHGRKGVEEFSINLQKQLGLTDVRAKSMAHKGSYRVFVQGEPVVDITDISSDFIGSHKAVYKPGTAPTIDVEGLPVAKQEFLLERKYLMSDVGKKLDKTLTDIAIMTGEHGTGLKKFLPHFPGHAGDIVIKPEESPYMGLDWSKEKIFGISDRPAIAGMHQPFIWSTPMGHTQTWALRLKDTLPGSGETKISINPFKRLRPTNILMEGSEKAMRLPERLRTPEKYDEALDFMKETIRTKGEPVIFTSPRSEMLRSSEIEMVDLSGLGYTKKPDIYIRPGVTEGVPKRTGALGKAADKWLDITSKLTGSKYFYKIPSEYGGFHVVDVMGVKKGLLGKPVSFISDETAATGLLSDKIPLGGLNKIARATGDYAKGVTYFTPKEAIGIVGYKTLFDDSRSEDYKSSTRDIVAPEYIIDVEKRGSSGFEEQPVKKYDSGFDETIPTGENISSFKNIDLELYVTPRRARIIRERYPPEELKVPEEIFSPRESMLEDLVLPEYNLTPEEIIIPRERNIPEEIRIPPETLPIEEIDYPEETTYPILTPPIPEETYGRLSSRRGKQKPKPVGQGYVVEIKNRQYYQGKKRGPTIYNQINIVPLTLGPAKTLMAKILDETPAATGRIIRVDGTPMAGADEWKRHSHKFYLKNKTDNSMTYVERTKHRISSQGELKGITLEGIRANMIKNSLGNDFDFKPTGRSRSSKAKDSLTDDFFDIGNSRKSKRKDEFIDDFFTMEGFAF